MFSFEFTLSTEQQIWLGLCLYIPILVWGFFLKQKFIAPYTLREASDAQKWRWAAILTMLGLSGFPLMGAGFLIEAGISNGFDVVLVPGIVIGLIFVMITVSQRVGFDQHLKKYRQLDDMIKVNKVEFKQSLRFLDPLSKWYWSRNDEYKVFLEKGYSTDRIEKKRDKMDLDDFGTDDVTMSRSS